MKRLALLPLILLAACCPPSPRPEFVEIAVPTVVAIDPPPVTFTDPWRAGEPVLRDDLHLAHPVNVGLLRLKVTYLKNELDLRDAWIESATEKFEATKVAR